MTVGIAAFWATHKQTNDEVVAQSADAAIAKAYACRAVGDTACARDVVLGAMALASPEEQPFLIADLGRTAVQTKDYASGISCFRKALALAPDYAPTKYALASLLAYTGQLEEADRLFRENIPVLAGNGDVTTTATIRFLP